MSDMMTPEEFLEHHGVKGMKWGVRRTDAQLGNSSSKKSKKKPSTADIKEARARVAVANAKKNEKTNKIISTINVNNQKSIDDAVSKVNKIETEALYNPDRITAARMTNGEKVAAVLLGVPYISAHREAHGGSSKAIEKAQRDRKY